MKVKSLRRNPYTPRSTKTVFWAQISAVAVFLFPLSLQHLDYRSTFSFGVSVSAHKSSPAYAAFEDLREAYNSDQPKIPENGKLIAAGEKFDFNSALQKTAIRQIVSRGMTIHMPANLEPKPIYVAGESMRLSPVRTLPSRKIAHFQPEMPTAAPEPVLRDKDGDLLPLAERKKRLLASAEMEDWTPPTATQKAEELVQQQLREMKGNEEIIQSVTGTSILIRKTLVTPPMAVPASPALASAKIVPPPPTPIPPPVTLAKNDVKPADVKTVSVADQNPAFGFASTITTRNPDPDNIRPLWLTGQIEMTDGLAFLGSDTQMVVRRSFNGQNFETGRIWVTEGRFEIHVSQPIGFLVAELQTRDGRVLGRGEISLIDLKGVPHNDNKVSDIRIALHPTTEGATFHAISGYSYGGQKMPITEARVEVQAYSDPQKVNSEGIVTEPTLSRESSFVARAVAKNHWPSLVVGQARDAQDIRLFANTLVDALMNLDLSGTDKREAYQESVVWGQVTRDGRPVEGAQVEMAGDYQPIYFSDMYMPDRKMAGTSSNGLFAFVKVRAGVQAVRVKIAGKQYPAQIFPTENKTVSYVEVGLRDKVISQFKVFDGLNMNKPVVARVRLVGTDDTLPVQSNDFVEYAVAANPFMVEADGGMEYEVSRVTVTGSPHVIHVPLVNRDWLYRLSVEKNIVPVGHRGTIVGYMDDQDFEVELTGYAPLEQMQIVYFDAQGSALASKTGVAGGGFVIFNAPEGLQTLYVHPTQSRETFSQIVVAEPQFVQVVTH